MDPYFQQQKTPEECKLNSYLGKAKFIDRFLSLENEVAMLQHYFGCRVLMFEVSSVQEFCAKFFEVNVHILKFDILQAS